jgi:hypothetical protein
LDVVHLKFFAITTFLKLAASLQNQVEERRFPDQMDPVNKANLDPRVQI